MARAGVGGAPARKVARPDLRPNASMRPRRKLKGRPAMPIQPGMDGFASPGAAPVTGPQLDNRRVLAALIDLALLVPVALAMSALFGGFTPEAQVLTAGWALYYYFALESGEGQTLGKRIMKIRVARADGGPLDMGRVAVRTLLRPIDAIGAYLLGLVVMIATGKRRQRLGDLAAGTVVTEADAPAPQVAAAVATPEAPVEETELPLDEPELPVADTGLPEIPSYDEPPAPDEPAPHDFVADEPSHDPSSPVDAGDPLPDLSQDEPSVPEVRPFELFAEPTPEADPVDEPVTDEPEPAAEEMPEPVVEEVPEQTVEDQPEPAEVSPPKLEIVSSPIELVMQEDEEDEGDDGEDDPEQGSGPVPA
jgi:uncharacterized RDD family membrane protein YckC